MKEYSKLNKISFIIFLIIFNNFVLYNISLFINYINKKKFINEITKEFNLFNKVNIDSIDNKINKKKRLNNYINSTINIGVALDINYVLETIVTITSIMATQNRNTKIRFHFGVTNNFTAEKMLKIYELKNRINNLTEFNFYFLKESVTKLKNFHPKGVTCPGKLELPLYVPNDVERIILLY